jgi:hypothetical protein
LLRYLKKIFYNSVAELRLNKFWGFLIKNKRHGGCFNIYKNKPPCMKIFKKAIR